MCFVYARTTSIGVKRVCPFEVQTGRIVYTKPNIATWIFASSLSSCTTCTTCVCVLCIFLWWSSVTRHPSWNTSIADLTAIIRYLYDRKKCTSASMCDPTALLDLVPGEGLLRRPSMDYNEYTYCYGGGRGGWHFFFPSADVLPRPGTSSRIMRNERDFLTFHILDYALHWLFTNNK